MNNKSALLFLARFSPLPLCFHFSSLPYSLTYYYYYRLTLTNYVTRPRHSYSLFILWLHYQKIPFFIDY